MCTKNKVLQKNLMHLAFVIVFLEYENPSVEVFEYSFKYMW